MVMPLEAEAAGFFAKFGLKIAAYAVGALLLVGAGAYGMHRWDAGTIEKLRTQVTVKQDALTVSEGSVTRLQKAIDDRNKKISDDAAAYEAKVRAAEQAQAAADARAARAERTANALKLARPKPGEDTVMQGVELVLGSVK